MSQQFIDVLSEQVRSAARFNSSVQVAPAAILWTDQESQWQSAMPLIKQAMPELIELGEYSPETRTGPAIWIKCVIARLSDDVTLPDTAVPIIYLPGVKRDDLRAIEQCPMHLQPLAELQYRGCWWAYNTTGRDWSVTAFLSSDQIGLDLDISRDNRTQEAISSVLTELLESPVSSLQGKRVETDDFHALVIGDPIKDLLVWLNDPKTKQQQWPANKWSVFCDTCQQQFGFDPNDGVKESLLGQLCTADQQWEAVWQRFVDTAHNLPGLVNQLASVKPFGLLDEASHFLSINNEKETALESELHALLQQDADSLRSKVLQLEQNHAERRDWIWHRLGYAPFASILKPLSTVIEQAKEFSGPSPQVMADAYESNFWQVDAAALEAMSLTKESQQQELVANLLAVLYTPWLERTALEFQRLVEQQGYPGSGGAKQAAQSYQDSQVVLFVDGLRFDTAQRLMEKLAGLSAKSELATHWSALPSLTATAKAAVTPIADLLTGTQDNDNFLPILDANEKELGSHHFGKALDQRGWQFLDGLDTGKPDGRAWVQMGDLDHLGHEQQRKLPLGIDSVLNEVTERVDDLLAAGWYRIRIVTDHGWLWVPDKLPKSEISKNSVRKRLTRCAILKDNVQTGHLKMHWHWNENVTIAMAPGISGYVAGDYYNHGGVSLQECLVPVIEIAPTSTMDDV